MAYVRVKVTDRSLTATGVARRTWTEFKRDLRLRVRFMPTSTFPNDPYAIVCTAWGISPQANTSFIAKYVGISDYRKFHENMIALTVKLNERCNRDTISRENILAALGD